VGGSEGGLRTGEGSLHLSSTSTTALKVVERRGEGHVGQAACVACRMSNLGVSNASLATNMLKKEKNTPQENHAAQTTNKPQQHLVHVLWEREQKVRVQNTRQRGRGSRECVREARSESQVRLHRFVSATHFLGPQSLARMLWEREQKVQVQSTRQRGRGSRECVREARSESQVHLHRFVSVMHFLGQR